MEEAVGLEEEDQGGRQRITRLIKESECYRI